MGSSIFSIARNICAMGGDASFSDLDVVLRATHAAANDMSLNLWPKVKSCVVQLGENMTAPVPTGATSILKVGVISDQGRILHVYHDTMLRRSIANDMVAMAEGCEDNAAEIANSIFYEMTPDLTFHSVLNNDIYVGRLFGFRTDPSVAGTWRWNVERGVIEFGSGYYISQGTYVVIEYSAVDDDVMGEVMPGFDAAIMARAKWYICMASDRVSQAIAFDSQFQKEYQQCKRRLNKQAIQEYLAGFKEGVMRRTGTRSTISIETSSTDQSTPGGSSGGGSTIDFSSLPTYTGNDAAVAAGLSAGSPYKLDFPNDYSLPGNILMFVE